MYGCMDGPVNVNKL